MRWSRRSVLLAGAGSAAITACAYPQRLRHASAEPAPVHEWRGYASDNASSKYSALDQINHTNVASLRIVWEWQSPDADIIRANPDLNLAPGEFQATPIMADGLLYTSTAMSQVAARSTGR